MGGIFGPGTVNDIAKMLAGEHAADDPAIERIFLVPHADEVRLIEVTPSVQPDGEILPFRFAAADDIPFRSLIVMVNPSDWERRSELRWPAELNPASAELELIFQRAAPAA